MQNIIPNNSQDLDHDLQPTLKHLYHHLLSLPPPSEGTATLIPVSIIPFSLLFT